MKKVYTSVNERVKGKRSLADKWGREDGHFMDTYLNEEERAHGGRGRGERWYTEKQGRSRERGLQRRKKEGAGRRMGRVGGGGYHLVGPKPSGGVSR